jgi:translation initiation factor 2-alpha kinase 3
MNVPKQFFSDDKMSSIFQSSYDDDSSTNSIESSENDMSKASGKDNHGSTDYIPRSSLEAPMALARLSGTPTQLPNFQPHQHSTLFYLSLIEGRCRTQAASALNVGRRLEDHLPEHHPEVHGLAQHLFGEMTKELHKAGVLPDEFAGQELSELRRNYLSSFDAILNNIAAKKTYEFQDNNTYSSIFDRSNGYALGGELLSNSLSNARAFALQRYTMAPSTQELFPCFPALTLGDKDYKKAVS